MPMLSLPSLCIAYYMLHAAKMTAITTTTTSARIIVYVTLYHLACVWVGGWLVIRPRPAN